MNCLSSAGLFPRNSFNHLSEFKRRFGITVIELQLVKTARISIHYALTRRKLSILDRLTAEKTHSVCFWSKLFKGHELKVSWVDIARFFEQVGTESSRQTERQFYLEGFLF